MAKQKNPQSIGVENFPPHDNEDSGVETLRATSANSNENENETTTEAFAPVSVILKENWFWVGGRRFNTKLKAEKYLQTIQKK